MNCPKSKRLKSVSYFLDMTIRKIIMYCFFKRIIDIVLSIILIIALIPLWVVLPIIIKLSSKGPVLFKQKRIGINKSYFTIYKFRTMKIDTPSDIPTHLMKKHDQHITKIGTFLRKTSLDEFPQIINILKGDMSIVGPRPALWNQDDLIYERDKYSANNVKPGLTGWAQVNGRDELEIKYKAKLDGEYVKNIGFIIDFKCIFKTLWNVIKSEGIVEGGDREN